LPDYHITNYGIEQLGKKHDKPFYLATIAYTDMNIGHLLDALEKSAYKDNTIICFWSDHGWHIGKKHHWRKFALWEDATLSPLIWGVPGMTKPGTVSERTVDFMTILSDTLRSRRHRRAEACRGKEHPPAAQRSKGRVERAGRHDVSLQEPHRAHRGLAAHPLCEW
jgi:arylsulfatase A-like enzyme